MEAADPLLDKAGEQSFVKTGPVYNPHLLPFPPFRRFQAKPRIFVKHTIIWLLFLYSERISDGLCQHIVTVHTPFPWKTPLVERNDEISP